MLHRFIVWYLRRCAGAFHCFPYGVSGRYVVLMDDDMYHRYTMTIRDCTDDEYYAMVDTLKESNG